MKHFHVGLCAWATVAASIDTQFNYCHNNNN